MTIITFTASVNSFALPEQFCSRNGATGNQCACKGLSNAECINLANSPICVWETNVTEENFCANKTNESSCYASRECNWYENYLGNQSCFPFLCQDKPGCADTTVSSSADITTPSKLMIAFSLLTVLYLTMIY